MEIKKIKIKDIKQIRIIIIIKNREYIYKSKRMKF